MPSATRSWRRDEVEPGDELGDGVLDLKPGVDLQEGEAPVGEEQELDGAGVHVADGSRHGDRGGPQLGAPRRCHGGGGALLDDLLVAALDRALPFEEVHHVAVGVAQDLHLDVAGARHVGLDEHGPVAEGRGRLSLRGGHGVGEGVGALHHAHAPASAAGRRLHQHGPPQRLHRRDDGVARGAGTGGDLHRREHGHARRRHRGLGRQLRAHGLDDVGRGPHEHQSRRHTGPGEPGVLGQEPVAGVHGVGAAGDRGVDDGLDVEVGVGGGGAGQAHELVGLRHIRSATTSGSEHTATHADAERRARRGSRDVRSRPDWR